MGPNLSQCFRFASGFIRPHLLFFVALLKTGFGPLLLFWGLEVERSSCRLVSSSSQPISGVSLMKTPLAFLASDLVPQLPVVIPPGIANVAAGVSTDCFSGVMTNPEYHAVSDYLSTSQIKPLLRSPAHLKAYLDNRDDDSGSPNIGTAAHAAILEPTSFLQDYAVYHGRRAGKDWESFKEANPGKKILSETEMNSVAGMREAVLSFADYPLAKAIEIGEVEKSIFWQDQQTGIKCRMRADLWTPYALFDVKTIDDARPDNIIRQVLRMDYDLQAAMYTEGARHFSGQTLPFIFVFVELKAPHGVWVYPAGQSIIENGTKKIRSGLEACKRLLDTQNWHGYQNAITTLELPRWVGRKDVAANDNEAEPSYY